MAERAATGGRTHLRGMRERTDTATNAIAQEKRSQHRFSMSSSQSSNTRSPFKLVTDGSVLKNDIKQQLAKERREEKRRQQDATKEMQLLEKERKAKIQYEKQMEEKQRKLREQKQKDEQRRISAEEKRKQKLREDKEKFKAVVSRTLERNNHIERVKRSEASMTVNSESKMVNKPSVAIEKLEQETSGSNKQRTVPSSSLQNSVAKSVHNPVMQYTNMPLLSPSRDELKNTVELFCKSTVAISPQEKKGIPLKANMKMIREESLETIPEESMEEPATANVKVPPESCPAVSVETSSKVKVRDTPQKSNPNKKRPLTQVPLSRWPSASGWCSSYPFSANRQIQKNHPPSFFLVMAEQPAQPSLSGKALPVQYDLCAQNVLDTIKRKKESVSKTTTSSETLSREHVTDEESARKGSQGIMSAEEETNILAAKQHLAHEPREKEEKLQKEMEQRKEIDVARKEIEGQEVFSKFDNGQRQKKITKKKRCQDQQNQKMLLQKGDSQIKAQEEANECQKEQEKSVLWNLPERSERKKRFEEIMKRTRKTNLNTSKVSPTAGTDIYEEHEADDEDESESDDANYFDLPASTSGVSPFRKTKASFRNVKRIPRLLFLDVNSDKVYSVKKTSLKSDVKNLRQKAKDPLAQAKGIRLSTNTIMNQVTKTDKAGESSNTMEPPRSLQSMTQESTHDQILDITSEIEPLESDILPDSQKHYLKGSLTFYRSSQIPLEDKDRDKSDSASSDI
ncbi:MAP7 domain containing 3 [Phyllostomus discolor]|uniref:MAP7 domain containing 3 n=1 Tax=Phyllostomus discolor TaxID=89673 RepID=A0A833Z6N0_9CHIR|nr:MAP7 domain containing 3 [Phyllostomus discolor]